MNFATIKRRVTIVKQKKGGKDKKRFVEKIQNIVCFTNKCYGKTQ